MKWEDDFQEPKFQLTNRGIGVVLTLLVLGLCTLNWLIERF